MRYHVLEGSERYRPTADFLGAVDPKAMLKLTIATEPGMGQERGSRFTDAVTSVRMAGLEVVYQHPPTNTIRAICTAGYAQKVFKTNLGLYRSNGVRFRGRVGFLALPEPMSKYIVAVMGLDTRPQWVPSGPPLNVEPGEGTAGILAFGGKYRKLRNRNVTVVGKERKHETAASNQAEADVRACGKRPVYLYFFPNTSQGHYDATQHAAMGNHAVVLCSWKEIEPRTPCAVKAVENMGDITRKQPLLTPQPWVFKRFDTEDFLAAANRYWKATV